MMTSLCFGDLHTPMSTFILPEYYLETYLSILPYPYLQHVSFFFKRTCVISLEELYFNYFI